MPTRKLLILTGVFLALLAFVVFYERHQPNSEEAFKAKRRLVDFKAEEVRKITVERSDLPKVELSKGTGDRWTVGADPAESGTVTALLADLGRLDLVGETRTSFDPAEFGLDAPKAKVLLERSAGPKISLVFGKAIPGTDTTAAAIDGRFGAVRSAPLTTLSKPLDDFRSKALFQAPTSEVARIAISRGPARIVVSREAGAAASGKSNDWKLDEPVKDLASRTFVEQLLADLAGARISEFPSIGAAELPRVGLKPPLIGVDLQKSGGVPFASLAFGAVRAETAGKMFALREKTVIVIDDRIEENLLKELSAYREKHLWPADAWSTARVSLTAGQLSVGAERVEGEWLSSGKVVVAADVENLIERIGKIEAASFVSRKEYGLHGLPGPGQKLPAPALLVELTPKGETARSMRFYPAVKGTGAPSYLVEVTGRGDALSVDRAAVDELKGLAAKIQPEKPKKK